MRGPSCSVCSLEIHSYPGPTPPLIGFQVQHGSPEERLILCRPCFWMLGNRTRYAGSPADWTSQGAIGYPRRDVGRKCHDGYHNRETHAENRKHRTEQAILEAKQLVATGKSSDVIQEQTGLSWQVVEQIRSGDLSPNSQQRPKTVTQPKHQTAGLDPTLVPIPLTREQLETIMAEEAHRDNVYMEGIRAERKNRKQKPTRKSK